MVQARLLAKMGAGRLIGSSPAFISAIGELPLLASADVPVPITGETGTGKDLYARAIHSLSPRREGPFIAVDCGAVPPHLFENELFGHARGAFTDAHKDQRGLAAMADGGTLFLDEIDSLSLETQSKILRFLQERTYRPLGSDGFVNGDVRLVAATNCDIEQSVADGAFRSDLYFRINILRVDLPPLRQRPSDIPILSDHFLSTFAREGGPKRLSPAALARLADHEWPGNVRELQTVIHRAILYSQGSLIQPGDLRLPELSLADSVDRANVSFSGARTRAIEIFERQYVKEMIEKHRGNVTHAARDAGKERRAFGRLVKKYDIDPKTYQ